MCGILGSVPRVDDHKFRSALNLLHHRGPDSFGIEHFDKEISLGHKRLAILDLSEQGHQPMSRINDRYTIVFNGEIYNFLELRKELEKEGVEFNSVSDTEVLLYSYIVWGKQCVHKFNGMWAFAIWDKREKELFLSRDRFGQKPLFYYEKNDKFFFASEMKAIMPFLDRVQVSEDFHWMKRHIFDYESTEKCLIKSVKRFPAGYFGIYKDNRLRLERYWNTLDHLVEPPKNYGDQVERFRELFLDACKIRMRSDVSIGTALSGGLDSSATISTMAHLASLDKGYTEDWQHAYVATFPDSQIDESKHAKKVLEHIGVNGTFVTIDPISNWEKLYDYLFLFEELYITSPIPMVKTYNEVKRHGTTVTLDGHGADELLSGYSQLVEALWDSKHSIEKTWDVLKTIKERTMNNELVENKVQLQDSSMVLNFLLKKAVKKLLNMDFTSNDQSHPNYRKLDNLTKQLYVLFHETILPTLLRNYDRYSMSNSVEIRMPFMDHRLVGLAMSLPYSSKIGNGYTKRIVRDAMDPLMPKEITWRKSKVGFTSPILRWIKNDLKDWFLDLSHSKSFLECELLDDPKEIQNSILSAINDDKTTFTQAQKCWIDISPYLWHEAMFKKSMDIQISPQKYDKVGSL